MASRNDNKELLKEYLTTNDKKVYDKLFSNNINLIYLFISRYMHSRDRGYNELIDEYFDVGCIGLHKAITSFNLDKIDDITFATYALKCIRNEIYMQIRKERKLAKADIFLDDTLGENEDFTYSDMLSDESYRPDKIVEEKDYDEYKKRKISEAILKLNSRSKKVFSMLYGKNRYSYSEIAKELNISEDVVNKIAMTIREYLREELKEFSKEYSSEQKHTKKYLNIFSNEVKQEMKSKKKRESSKSGYSFVSNVGVAAKGEDNLHGESISRPYMVNRERVLNLEDKLLLDLYKKYGKEKVKEIIDVLEEENKFLLSLFCGLDAKAKNIDEITATTNYSNKVVRDKIISALKEVRIVVNSNKYGRIKFLEFSKSYGVSKTLEAIAKLKNQDKEILKLYYGLDGKEPRSLEEMSRILNKDGSKIKNLMFKIHSRVEDVLNGKVVSLGKNKLNELYSKYGKDKVDDAIKVLEEDKRIIFEMYHGLNGNDAKTTRKISEIYSVKEDSIIVIVNACIKKLDTYLSTGSIYGDNDKLKKLIDEYGEDKVDDAIKKLNPKFQDMLRMRHGLDGNTPKSINDIVEVYNSTYTSIVHTLQRIYSLIEEHINGEKIDYKGSKIEKLYAEYGKDNVIEIINSFNDQYKQVLSLYYGLDGKSMTAKEISDILGLDHKSVIAIASNASAKLKKFLVKKIKNRK